MSAPHINPLQDSVEALRVQTNALRADLSQLLRAEAWEFYVALHAVIEAGGTSHVDPPQLTADERGGDDVPAEGIFDSIFDDDRPQRHLKDVWNGQGDYNDPLVPQDEHEHELVLARLRSDPEQDWQATRTAEGGIQEGKLIGSDYTTANQPE